MWDIYREPRLYSTPGPVTSGLEVAGNEVLTLTLRRGLAVGTTVVSPVTVRDDSVRAVVLLDSVLSSGVSGVIPDDQLTPKRQKHEYLFIAQEPAKACTTSACPFSGGGS